MFFIKELQNKFYLCFTTNNQTELQSGSNCLDLLCKSDFSKRNQKLVDELQSGSISGSRNEDEQEYTIHNRSNINISELNTFVIDNILYLLEVYNNNNYNIRFNTNCCILSYNDIKKSVLIEIYHNFIYIYDYKYKEIENKIEFLYPNYKIEFSNNINFYLFNNDNQNDSNCNVIQCGSSCKQTKSGSSCKQTKCGSSCKLVELKYRCPDIINNEFQIDKFKEIFQLMDINPTCKNINLDIILNDSIYCFDKNTINNGYFYIKDYMVYNNKGKFLGYIPNNYPSIKKCISY